MQINFNDNNIIENPTFNEFNGVDNQFLQQKDWEELKRIVDGRLQCEEEFSKGIIPYREMSDIVNQRDEKGLKKFIQRDKDDFFTNVLSNIASSGLIALLKMLIKL